jgi:WD40 repeat protein
MKIQRRIIMIGLVGLVGMFAAPAQAQGIPIGARLQGARVAWNPVYNLVGIAAGSTIAIADAATLETVVSLSALHSPVTWLDWDPTGTRLAAASGFEVYIWQVSPQGDQAHLTQTLHAVNDDPARDYEISQIQWHPTADKLLGVNLPNALVWDAASGEVLEVLTYSRIPITTALWNADGSSVAAGGINTTVVITNNASETSTVIRTQETSDPIMISALAWSPDGKYLATSGIFDCVRIWDITGERPAEVAHFVYQTSDVFALAWSPTGNLLAIGGEDGIWFWDTDQSMLQDSFSTESMVISIDWNPDGSQIIYGEAADATGIFTLIDPPGTPAATRQYFIAR